MSLQIADTPGLGGTLGLVAVLAAIPLFWFGFEGLLQEWAKPEFRFKSIVPLFSFVLFVNVLRDMDGGPERDWTAWLGVACVATSLSIAVLGNRLAIDDFVFLSIILWCAGLVVTCVGLRGALSFWAPLGSLCLMVPLPRFVFAPIQSVLEAGAAKAAMHLLGAAGVPARIQGQLVEFGGYRIGIDEAAAGIECFLPLMLLFFFLATFHNGPLWTRTIPLALAVPVVVLAGSCRILAVGLVLSTDGEEAVASLLAIWNEWVFFAICAAILLAATLGAQRLAHAGPLLGPEKLLVSDVVRHVRRMFSGPCRPPLLVVTAASVFLSALFLLVPTPVAATIEREPFRLFPPEIGAWTGSSAAIDPGVASVLKADDYVNIDYFHPNEAAPVNFWSAFYSEQKGDKAGVHSPQDCLPNDGWNILSFRQVDLSLAGAAAVQVNRVIIEKGASRALVYYWFDGRSRRVADERLARIMVKVDGLLRARTDGALVRYTTMVRANETEADADARLRRFVGETIDKLPRFIPE